jgi:hypothetical protein
MVMVDIRERGTGAEEGTGHAARAGVRNHVEGDWGSPWIMPSGATTGGLAGTLAGGSVGTWLDIFGTGIIRRRSPNKNRKMGHGFIV